jgi:hypothetical protein
MFETISIILQPLCILITILNYIFTLKAGEILIINYRPFFPNYHYKFEELVVVIFI